jgi:PAS domain S-box-containing protein
LHLAEAESRYKSLFSSNRAVMMLIRPEDGRIVEVNPAACQYYGWTNEEFKAMNISQINTLSQGAVLAKIANAVAEKQNLFEFRHRRASGEVADVEVYSGPITVNGETLLYSIVHDVSERIASQKALVESESRFRQLVEAAPEAIFIETGQKFVFVNQAAIQLFGAQTAQHGLPRPYVERVLAGLVHPGRLGCRAFQAAWRGGRPQDDTAPHLIGRFLGPEPACLGTAISATCRQFM